MIKFEGTFDILGDATNQTANHNNMGSGDESRKKRLPVTAHPSKPKPQNGDGSLPEESDPTDACISQVSSPQMTEQTQGNAAAGEEEEEEEEAEDNEWKAFVESATSEDAPNLEAFLDAKSLRETAKENFSAGLEEGIAGLHEAMINDMLQDSVVAVHQEQGERFEAYEADIIVTMKSNHARRRAFLKRMDNAHVRWEMQYKRLRGNILKTESQKNQDFNTGEPRAVGVGISNGVDDKDQQGGEPEWDELAEFEPTSDNVRCFLEARERFQHAEERLSQALDDIHAGLKAEADAIVQILLDLHNRHESNCLSFEHDIQYHLIQNGKRKAALQKSLEESAKQAQGLFANLLSRLSHKL